MANDSDVKKDQDQNRPNDKAEARRRRAAAFNRAAGAACYTLLGLDVTGVDLPGGNRQSIRVHCGKKSVIVTRRPNPKRARLEVSALYALGSHGGAVPKVLAFDGIWLIQEDLGDRRLSQALSGASAKKAERWLDAGVKSVEANQNAATSCAFEKSVITIGTDPGWVRTVLSMPARLGKFLGIAPPPLREQELAKMLRVREPFFIKWDARPGNAMARADGTAAWFDWEHAGCRNRMDDLVWFLADEYTPDWPKAEEKVLARYLDSFAKGMGSKDEALEYFHTFGTLHSCVRLALIMTSKEDGPWWNAEKVLAGDKVGVTRTNCLNSFARIARWAAQAPLVKNLLPWLEQLPERLPPENPPKNPPA
jgi:hypothetical protein